MLCSTYLAAVLPLLARAAPIEKRADTDTSNGVLDGPCEPVTVIYARGTTETGNIGTTVGPALKAQLGPDVAFQGVEYPAQWPGDTQQIGNNPGVAVMVRDAQTALRECPASQLVLSGYSQGGIVTHGAMQQLGADAQRVRAVVTFGDPMALQPVANIQPARVKIFCALTDAVCADTAIIGPAHLGYDTNGDVGLAVNFIRQQTATGA